MILTKEEMADLIDWAEATQHAKCDQLAAGRLKKERQKTRVGELNEMKRLRTDAWEATKIDNQTLLERWEVLKAMCCEKGDNIPPKLHVAMCVEVWALLSDGTVDEEQGNGTEWSGSPDEEAEDEDNDDDYYVH